MLVCPLKHRVAAISFFFTKSNLKSATLSFSIVKAGNLKTYKPPVWLPQIALSKRPNLETLDMKLSSLNKSYRSSMASDKLISEP